MRKKERLTNGYFLEQLVLAYTTVLMSDLGQIITPCACARGKVISRVVVVVVIVVSTKIAISRDVDV